MGSLVNAQSLQSIATRRTYLPLPVDREDPRWEESWRYLCETYRPAMVRFVATILSDRIPPEVARQEAPDVTQAYIASCLEKGWLNGDGQTIASFRAYLQVQLRRFVMDWLDHRFAARRTPTREVPWDCVADLPAGDDQATAELNAAYLQVAVDRALAELEKRNPGYARLIRSCLTDDGDEPDDEGDEPDGTPQRRSVTRWRARRRFVELLAQELRATVTDEDTYQALIAHVEPYLP